jgi:hypothetical protein
MNKNKSQAVVQTTGCVCYCNSKTTRIIIIEGIRMNSTQGHMQQLITLWGGDPCSKKIFTLQKKVIRIMCKVDQRTSCRFLFRKLDILPLPCLFISEMVCWIKYYRGKLTSNLDLHDYNTHKKFDLHQLTCRTNLTRDYGLNLGIKLYNKLPGQIKQLDPKHKFKTNVKKFLLQHTFYSIEEFLSF